MYQQSNISITKKKLPPQLFINHTHTHNDTHTHTHIPTHSQTHTHTQTDSHTPTHPHTDTHNHRHTHTRTPTHTQQKVENTQKKNLKLQQSTGKISKSVYTHRYLWGGEEDNNPITTLSCGKKHPRQFNYIPFN